MKKILFLSFVLGPLPLPADVSINLDAGQLQGSSEYSMIADDTSPSTNGSLLLLFNLGASGVVNNTLPSGNYVSGTNFVLAAGGFNDNGGTNETLTAFDVPESLMTSAVTGSEIALRWFPQITLSEYNAGILPTAGDVFGTYNPNGGNPDGGDLWALPSDGSLVNLDFYTMNSDDGGSQPAFEGIANYNVMSEAPEPSEWRSLLLGLLALLYLKRGRCLTVKSRTEKPESSK